MIQPQLSPNCLSLWTPSWGPPPPDFLTGSYRATDRGASPLQCNAALQAFLGSFKPASIPPSTGLPLHTNLWVQAVCGAPAVKHFLGDPWTLTLALLPTQ